MIDIAILAVIAAVTWCVASDGPWGAAITFVSVILSGLLAMNFFEPVAQFLATSVMNSYEWQHRWDVIVLVGLFAAAVTLLRMLGETLLPTYAEVENLLYEFARWGLGLATGYVVAAILLTALHTAPLPREFMGFTPERNNLFDFAAPDRQWLGFTQYVSEKSLRTSTPMGTPVFDGPTFPRIPSDLSTNQVWASFPIKYAARRQQFTTGQASSASSLPAAPPPQSTPGGGGAGGGF